MLCHSWNYILSCICQHFDIQFFFLSEESKNATRNFNDQITSLQASLDEAERTLAARTAAPLPRDLDSLEHLVIEHKEFETQLQVGGPVINSCIVKYEVI
jgi:hypothetical protein